MNPSIVLCAAAKTQPKFKMSLRSSVLAITLLGFLIVLMTNIQVVPFRFFLLSFRIPLFYVISISVLFGIIISYLFISLGQAEKKWKQYVEKAIRDEKPRT